MAKTNYLDLLGKNNKYMAAFNKYSPYLGFLSSMQKGGNMARNATEGLMDYGVSQIPGVGQAYQGVKLFNQATGGLNFNKMLGIKNPLGQFGDRIFGRRKTAEEEQAADPEYAKYMAMLSDIQNTSAAGERAALEKRKAIQPMQEKAVSDYMDILQNGLSSRQLAPVYAAGEARNRAIGAGAEAGLMSQVANRGMGGGIQAGLEAAVQANRNALSADLNSRITQQQIAARPGMLGQAANLTMGMENQVQQELAQAAMNRLNASQVGLSAYNAAQQNERLKESIANERAQARATEMGALIGKFGPDIAKAIKGLTTRKAAVPGQPVTPETPYVLEEGSTPTVGNDTSGALTDAGTKVSEEPYNPLSMGTESIGALGDISQNPDVTGIKMLPVEPSTRVRLDLTFDPNGTLPIGTRKTLNGVNFFKTKSGWAKSYEQLPGLSIGGSDLLDSISGVTGPNSQIGPGSSLNSGQGFVKFW